MSKAFKKLEVAMHSRGLTIKADGKTIHSQRLKLKCEGDAGVSVPIPARVSVDGREFPRMTDLGLLARIASQAAQRGKKVLVKIGTIPEIRASEHGSYGEGEGYADGSVPHAIMGYDRISLVYVGKAGENRDVIVVAGSPDGVFDGTMSPGATYAGVRIDKSGCGLYAEVPLSNAAGMDDHPAPPLFIHELEQDLTHIGGFKKGSDVPVGVFTLEEARLSGTIGGVRYALPALVESYTTDITPEAFMPTYNPPAAVLSAYAGVYDA